MTKFHIIDNIFEFSKISLEKKEDTNDAVIFLTGNDALEKALAKEGSIIKECQIHVEELIPKYTQKKQPTTKKKKSQAPSSSSESSLSDIDSDPNINGGDAEGYAAFMTEYKNYYKNTKRNLKSKVKSMQSPSADPNSINVEELLNKANNYYLSNRHAEAIEILHQIISASPVLQEPFQILSLIHEEQGDKEKALSFLMLAAQVSNGDKDIWIRCANFNRDIGNLQQAEYCITRALKLDKKNIFILYERGVLNEEIGNLHKAARIYETLLSLYAQLEILIHTAHIYEKVNNYEKGIKLLEDYYEKVNKKMQCLLMLFDFYVKSGEYERGVKMYNTLIQKGKEYENATNNSNFQIKRLFCFLYIALKHKGDVDYLKSLNMKKDSENEIVKDLLVNFQSLLRNDYDIESEIENLHKLFYLLQSLDRIGLFIEIFDEIEKSLNETDLQSERFQISKLNPEIFAKIGEYFASNENYEKSIHFYLKCLEIKNDDLIRVKLSELYGKINQNEKALEILNGGFSKEGGTDENKMEHLSNQKSYDSISEIEKEGGELYNDNHYLNTFISRQIDDDHEHIDENVIDESNVDDDFALYNELTIENKAIGIPTVFSNEYFNRESKATTKHLGKKRLKITSHVKQNDKVIIDYNFDNYLHNKIRKLSHCTNRSRSLSVSNASSTYQSLSLLKNEFDELSQEVKGNRNEYVKLQQSLVFLNANEIEKFCKNTFEPLQKVLLQEVKIENYKTDLFNYILDKSMIKNYFYKKTSIFDQKDIDEEEQEDLPLKEALKPYSERNLEDIPINEEDNKFVEKKDNLFVRKTANKYYLTKKKVAPTITLVEKELGNLENVEKFISPDNFFKLIEQFIIHSYNRRRYQEAHRIIALLFNSRNFLSRNDYFSYNLFLYGILTSYKTKQYKVAFELIKRNIVRYSIQDIQFFWIQLWNIGKQVPPKISRSFMYKLHINKNLSTNICLKLIVASCYFQSNNYELALNIFNDLVLEIDNPFLYFMISLCYLFIILSRNSKNREIKYIKAIRNLNLYAIKKIKDDPIEVAYNIGRYYQFMGHDRIAMNKYTEAYLALEEYKGYSEEKKQKMKTTLAYNMALIMKRGGNEEEAHQFLCENIVI